MGPYKFCINLLFSSAFVTILASLPIEIKADFCMHLGEALRKGANLTLMWSYALHRGHLGAFGFNAVASSMVRSSSVSGRLKQICSDNVWLNANLHLCFNVININSILVEYFVCYKHEWPVIWHALMYFRSKGFYHKRFIFSPSSKPCVKVNNISIVLSRPIMNSIVIC